MSSFNLSKYLGNKKIALLGLGVENEALLNWLLKHKIAANLTICDQRSMTELGERYQRLAGKKNINWRLGLEFNRGLEDFDLLLRSPGWTTRCPGISEGRRKNKKLIVTSAMNLFMAACPSKNVVGVTGTKGKGTTSSLITEIFKTAGCRVFLGGNIGIAPFAFLDELKSSDWIVLELSSFQLEDLKYSPRIAVLTNFTKEHLAPADPHNPNYHRNMKEYFAAKANVFVHKQCRYLVVNQKLKSRIKNYESQIVTGGVKELIAKKKILYFTKSALATGLPGGHNLENIAAAEAVAKLAKVPAPIVAQAVLKFKGLEHRLEKVGEHADLQFYDDSFATTPEATIIALRSFALPIVILLGGADKGADFRKLALQVKKSCNFVVLLKGVATPRIKKDLLACGIKKTQLAEVNNIERAVDLALAKAQRPGIVLLSTACASFGMFKNYKERGRLFKEEVSKKN